MDTPDNAFVATAQGFNLDIVHQQPVAAMAQDEANQTLVQALTGILERLQEQTVINDAIKDALANPAGRNSELQVRLPHFNGKVGENVTIWIFQCEAVFEAKKITQGEPRLQYISACLHDAALHWYQNECLQVAADAEPFDND
jgi:hypothetical protein